jgi:hypothetical protein
LLESSLEAGRGLLFGHPLILTSLRNVARGEEPRECNLPFNVACRSIDAHRMTC